MKKISLLITLLGIASLVILLSSCGRNSKLDQMSAGEEAKDEKSVVEDTLTSKTITINDIKDSQKKILSAVYAFAKWESACLATSVHKYYKERIQFRRPGEKFEFEKSSLSFSFGKEIFPYRDKEVCNLKKDSWNNVVLENNNKTLVLDAMVNRDFFSDSDCFNKLKSSNEQFYSRLRFELDSIPNNEERNFSVALYNLETKSAKYAHEKSQEATMTLTTTQKLPVIFLEYKKPIQGNGKIEKQRENNSFAINPSNESLEEYNKYHLEAVKKIDAYESHIDFAKKNPRMMGYNSNLPSVDTMESLVKDLRCTLF